MNMPAECAFCFLNLIKIQGTFKSSVSLFNRTANKYLGMQFCARTECLNANSFVLCDLLSAIGIKVRQENTLKSLVSSSNEGSKQTAWMPSFLKFSTCST